jgi:hypothetical protein
MTAKKEAQEAVEALAPRHDLPPSPSWMKFWRRKLRSLWESALSLCVGSRVKGANSNLTRGSLKANSSGAALEGDEARSHVQEKESRT